MSKGNTTENDVLEHLFKATALSWAANANLYIALHTGDPGEGGNQTTSEATYTSYARVADAAAGLIVPASATIAGTGGLSGDIVGVLDAVAALSGSGSLAATIQAPAAIVAALAGAATLSLDITATGAISATIEIGAQGELTPAGLAAALLDGADAIETGLTLRQALRIIAAATAGKVSGGGTTTITFRSAEADDTDRIVATVDSNGNRTAITLDLD